MRSSAPVPIGRQRHGVPRSRLPHEWPGLKLLQSLWYNVGPFLAVLAFWMAVIWWTSPDPLILASPKQVWSELNRIAVNGVLTTYISRSMMRLLVTGIIVIPIGVFVGLAIGLWDKISGALLDVFRFFTSIPALAWLPLFLVWFGFNEATVIMTVAYYFFFTVLFNTLSGIRTVPRVLQYAVLTMGGNRWQVIRHVLIPGAMPSIIAGIRLGFAYGWRGLIGAEMLVAQGGLGHLIFRAQSVGLTDRIIAGMVVIGLLAALIDYLIMQPIEEATIRRWGLIQR